ncbi:helix-turn-helix transcriptional regulator [Streptomyces hydrogenans]|uniref:helix-turn-helix transcriptional regulator n=1 Tax=Streptomyces hydrogenans TaxID=1873719 RepID=UPI0034450CFB
MLIRPARRFKESNLSVVTRIYSPGASVVGDPSAIERAFLGVKEAAAYLGISPRTLYVWRHRRLGPPSFRLGARGRVTYRLDALDAWVREQEQADSRSNPLLNPANAVPQRRAGYMTTA